MNWFFLSLLAPAILTACIFIDKYVLSSRVKDWRSVQLYQSVVAVVFVLVLAIWRPWAGVAGFDAWVIIAAGTVGTLGAVLYFYALANSHSSDVAVLLQVTPLFTLLIATAFLHEQLSGTQLIGFGLVMASVIGLSTDSSPGKFRFGSAFYVMLAADVLFAASAVLIKFASGTTRFLPVLFFESLGVVLAGLLLFALYGRMRRAFISSLRESGAGTLAIMFGNEALYVLSKAVTYLAILLGPVALVSVLGGTQVFYALIVGVVLSLWFPQTFQEHTAPRVVLRRAVLMVVLFVGVAAVQL